MLKSNFTVISCQDVSSVAHKKLLFQEDLTETFQAIFFGAFFRFYFVMLTRAIIKAARCK